MKYIGKNKVFIALAGLLMLSAVCPEASSGQKRLLERRVVQPGIRVLSSKVEQIGDSVYTNIELSIGAVELEKRDQLRIMPILYSEEYDYYGYGHEEPMPPVVVTGSIRQRLIRREEALTGQPDSVYVNYRTRGREKVSAKVDYSVAFPVKGWMNNAMLVLVQEACYCPGEYTTLSEDLLISGIKMMPRPVFNYNFNPNIQFIVPERETIKRRSESGQANIIYRAGYANINASLGNNAYELDKVRKSIEYVRSESTAQISGISVTSYASPEGTAANNQKLSERRAAEFSLWIGRTSGFDGSKSAIASRGMGEDWDGLVKRLKEDPGVNAYDVESILALINSEYDPDRRENRLKSYGGGAVYRYIFDNIYPNLRRSDYKIEYTVPEFTLEKSKEVFETRPELLSLAELYAIAGEYERGTEEFNHVFEVAARMYPDDKTANLNSAAAYMAAGKLTMAEDILKKYENDPQAWVNLGNLYFLKEDLDKAKQYYERAQSAGVSGTGGFLESLADYRSAKEQYERDLEEWEKYGFEE